MVLNNKNNKIISGGKYVKSSKNDIDPDEIFLDSSNLPNFDTHQFEGRIVSSISRRSIAVLSIFILLIFFIFYGLKWVSILAYMLYYFTAGRMFAL